MSAPVDLWSTGENYEPFIGRWSRLVAREFLPRLGVAAGGRWVDVGSGTGALTETILELCDPAAVVAVEPAPDLRPAGVVRGRRRRGPPAGRRLVRRAGRGAGAELRPGRERAPAEMRGGAAQFAEGSRFDVCAPEPLERLFTGAGLQDVAVEPIVVPTVFRDFDDYWNPFLLGQGPAPSYVTTLTEEAARRCGSGCARRWRPTAPGRSG